MQQLVGKGLLGQYAGFVSRAVGFVLDILIVIGLLWVVNFAITLPLQYFLGFNINQCKTMVSGTLPSIIDQSPWLCIAVISTQAALSLLAGPAYFILLWSMGGQTVGQYVAGVRVVRLNGRKMNFKSSLVRYLGYFVSFFALGLGYFWVLWDDRRQGFQDKLARTVVVYAWTARQNEFLLDRVRERMGAKAKVSSTAMTEDEIRALHYVILSFKLHTEMNSTLSSLEEAVRVSDFSVINVAVLVKDETGHLGLVGVSDLSMNTSGQMPLMTVDFRTIRTGLQRLLQHYPPESFVMVILVKHDMEKRLCRSTGSTYHSRLWRWTRCWRLSRNPLWRTTPASKRRIQADVLSGQYWLGQAQPARALAENLSPPSVLVQMWSAFLVQRSAGRGGRTTLLLSAFHP